MSPRAHLQIAGRSRLLQAVGGGSVPRALCTHFGIIAGPSRLLLIGAAIAVTLGAHAQAPADDLDTQYQLSLADVAGYRAALNGEPAPAPPKRMILRNTFGSATFGISPISSAAGALSSRDGSNAFSARRPLGAFLRWPKCG